MRELRRVLVCCLMLLLTGCAAKPPTSGSAPAAPTVSESGVPAPSAPAPPVAWPVAGLLAGPLPGAPQKAERVSGGWRYGPVPSVWMDSVQWLSDGRVAVTVGVNPNPLAGMVVLDPHAGGVEQMPYAPDRWGGYELVGSSLLYYTMTPELMLLTGSGQALRWKGWHYTQSPDGRYLLLYTGEQQNEIRRVTVAAPDEGKMIDFGITLWSRRVGTGAYWSPDGKYVAIEPPGAPVRVIDVEAWQVVATLPESPRLQVHGGWSPDGTRIALRTAAVGEEPACFNVEGDSMPSRTLVFWEPSTGRMTEFEPAPGRWVMPWGVWWTDATHLRLALIPEGPRTECEMVEAESSYFDLQANRLTPALGLDAAALLRLSDVAFSPDRQYALARVPRGSKKQGVDQVLMHVAEGRVITSVSDRDWQLGPWVGDALLAMESAAPSAERSLALLTPAGEFRPIETLPAGAALPLRPISPDGRWYAHRTDDNGQQWLVVKALP